MELSPTNMKYGLILAVMVIAYLGYRNYSMMAELEALEQPA